MTETDERVALVSVGYKDGYRRVHPGVVLIGGVKCPGEAALWG